MKILITGGAGFVGSRLALAFRADQPDAQITAFDNLRRRGSEINVGLFRKRGIDFVHGDIRVPEDFKDLNGDFDLMIEASAEPSVLAGLSSSPNYLLQTNLTGTLNCLELARERASKMIFLSTSRVYSLAPLQNVRLRESDTRLEIEAEQDSPGVGIEGINEAFPTNLPRSLYGASKLASELIIQEYADTYGYPAIINRCGVIAGAGQFGKTDQGVFTLWVANHFFKKALKYTGFGGLGKQVRDLLHPSDLYRLILKQLPEAERLRGQVFNVGGGLGCSTSLLELTAICRAVTGNEIAIGSDPTSARVDIPLYVSDARRASTIFDWRPKQSVEEIVAEIYAWIVQNEAALRPLFV